MDPIARYNGELARLNITLNEELIRSDILKSEELGTCEFIAEVASIYLETTKSCRGLPFTLPHELEEADKKIIANILIDRQNLIKARDSFLENGKVVPLTPEKIVKLLAIYEEESQAALEHVKQMLDIRIDMNLDAFEKKLNTLIAEQMELWGDLNEQKAVSNERVHLLQLQKQALQTKRSYEEAGSACETIHDAVKSGSLEKVVELIGGFFSIFRISPLLSQFDNNGEGDNLPLHLASFYGHHQIVKLLLKKGAQVDAVDKLGRQAIHWAAKAGYSAVFHELMVKGASINAKDVKFDRTPLHYATFNGLKEMTQFLIGRGANINVQATREGNTTPLHEAVRNGHHSVVGELVKSSSLDVNIVDSNYHSAIYLATIMGNSQALALLITHSSWHAPTDLGDPNHPEHLLRLEPSQNQARIKDILDKLQYLR